jgi:hypothetical protein
MITKVSSVNILKKISLKQNICLECGNMEYVYNYLEECSCCFE